MNFFNPIIAPAITAVPAVIAIALCRDNQVKENSET